MGVNLGLGDRSYEVIGRSGEVLIVAPIDRRHLLAAGGLLVPAGGLELARHDLFGSVVADRAAADADEWREIAWEYALGCLSAPPAELLSSLQVDILALGEALRRPHSDPAARELRKVGGLLAVFAALTVANLGDLRSARRGWRTAKQAADASGGIEARLWIRGGEVMRAVWEQRPTPVILDLVAEADAISAIAEAPPAAVPRLLTGKAMVLAVTGQATAAEAALREVRDNFDRLPAHITGDTESWFGWSEHNVRFTEGYVYSHLGDFARAEQAQAAALGLYPATDHRRPAMIELQRGLCLVSAGDVATGVEHAHATMISLPREQHVRPIVYLGRKVIDAVPVGERDRTSVQAFRDYLDSEEAA